MMHHSFLHARRSVVVHNTDIANRDKVLDKLRGFFGYENVVPISTMNQLKLKSLIKDLSKFYGIPFEEANAATRTVEAEVRKAVTRHGDDKNLFELKFEEAMGYVCKSKEPEAKPVCDGCTDACTTVVSPSFRAFIEKYPQLQSSIKVLFKQNRSLGRHAGGVLLADDLPNKMPLITSGGEPQTPWLEGVGVKTLEKIGNYIKYDILGLETLRLIERSIELIIKKNGGIVQFVVDGKTHRLTANTRVKLTNGEFVAAGSLSDGDDVCVPLELFEDDTPHS